MDLKTVPCCSGSKTSESFNWRAWGGYSPWTILQIWTFSILEYYFSGAWERLISKAKIVKTYDNSKLLLFWLRLERCVCVCVCVCVWEGGFMFYLCAWSTTLLCLLVMVKDFPSIFKKHDILEFGNLTFKWGVGFESGGKTHFSSWV